jgi:dipeptidyl aminopeptidase/acylaminoacyl peptidase
MLSSARRALVSHFALSLFCLTVHLNAESSGGRDPRIDSVLTELGKVRKLYQVAISPDGKYLAWVVDAKAGGGSGTEIELAPLNTPESTTRVTAGNKGQDCLEDSLAWSPDSATLAFLSDCQTDGQGDYYLYSPGARSPPRRLTHLHGIPEAPAFSPDGKHLGFLYVEGGTRRANPLAAEKPPAGVIGEEGLEIKGVATASIPSGETKIITPPSLYVYEFDWSPDANQLAYVAASPPGENTWWVAQLYVQNTQPVAFGMKPMNDRMEYQVRSILDPARTPGPLRGLQIAVPRWSPDGKQIAFIGGLMSDQGATGGDIYVETSSGGEARDVTADRASTPVWIRWTSTQSLGFTEVAGGETAYSELDLSSARSTQKFRVAETIGDGRLEGSLSFAEKLEFDNTIFTFVRSSFAKPAEVMLFQAGNKLEQNSWHQITHYNDSLKPSWGNAESLTWASAVQPSPTIPLGTGPNDFNVQGWLLYPANYDSSRKYPLIVYVHGGPSSAELPRWPETGFGPVPFAALGYFVLLPNPRGSYGQGEAFVQANRRDFGYGDLRDILAGVDSVTKSHNIDPERVGLTGWSYGGFMTMFAVTQTNRFRAAVAGAGISNWQSYYGQNSIDQWMVPFFGASVYDDPGVYAKSSAINFIHNIKTPTLAVVGDRDGECPAPQSFEFWHALKAQHVPTQLVVYSNEGHHFVDPEHQRDVLARSLAWFQKYMPAN